MAKYPTYTCTCLIDSRSNIWQGKYVTNWENNTPSIRRKGGKGGLIPLSEPKSGANADATCYHEVKHTEGRGLHHIKHIETEVTYNHL